MRILEGGPPKTNITPAYASRVGEEGVGSGAYQRDLAKARMDDIVPEEKTGTMVEVLDSSELVKKVDTIGDKAYVILPDGELYELDDYTFHYPLMRYLRKKGFGRAELDKIVRVRTTMSGKVEFEVFDKTRYTNQHIKDLILYSPQHPHYTISYTDPEYRSRSISGDYQGVLDDLERDNPITEGGTGSGNFNHPGYLGFRGGKQAGPMGPSQKVRGIVPARDPVLFALVNRAHGTIQNTMDPTNYNQILNQLGAMLTSSQPIALPAIIQNLMKLQGILNKVPNRGPKDPAQQLKLMITLSIKNLLTTGHAGPYPGQFVNDPFKRRAKRMGVNYQ